MDNIFSALVIDNIYKKLEIKDLYSCSMVNKKFNKVFNNDNLWKSMFNKYYGTSICSIVTEVYKTDNYKLLFRKCYALQKCVNSSEFNGTVFDDSLVKKMLEIQSVSFLFDVPLEFDSMINLRTMSIQTKFISDRVIEKIANHTSLKSLYINSDLRDTNIKKIYESQNLEDIDIASSNIQEINCAINSSSKLKSLSLTYNFISDTSPIGNFFGLCSLDISNNNISVLHRDFFNLQKLRSLRLTDNNIKHIPKEIQYLTNLTDLALCRNKFKEFPVEICSLTSLNVLKISNNYIKNIPINIAALNNLRSINLSYNNLNNISSLMDLTNIDIDVRHNINLRIINTLPPSISVLW